MCDRGRELAERGEPTGVVERGDGIRALHRESDASGEIARDEVRVAVERAVVDVERADQLLLGSEGGDGEAGR